MNTTLRSYSQTYARILGMIGLLILLFTLSTNGVSAGAIGEWKLNENTGRIASDRINNNDGILVGSTSWGSGNNEDRGAYVNFDGINSYIKINNSENYKDLTQATWNIWVKQESYKENAGLISKYEAKNDQRSFIIRTALTDGITVILSPDGQNATTYTSTSNNHCGIRRDDEWTMITIVYTGNKIEYYRNGIKCDEDTTSIRKIANTDTPITIGTASGRYYYGSADEILFYNTALDRDEVYKLYDKDATTYPSIKIDGRTGNVKTTPVKLQEFDTATWNMWLKQDNYVDRAGVIGKYENGVGNRSFIIRTALTDGISVILSKDGTTGVPHTSISNNKCGLRDNEWTMITIVYTGNKIEYYRNGIKCDEDTTTINKIYDSKTPITLGWANRISFDGRVDDYKIYEESLTSSQVKRLYDESERGKNLGQSITTLLYHQIVDNANAADKVKETEFEKQMEYLNSTGFKAIKVSDYNNWKKDQIEIPKKSILITFDDGWRSVYEKAYPIMKKYGLIGTQFLIGDYANEISGEPSYSDWNELKTMQDNGWDMEAHGMQHTRMLDLSESDFRQQLTGIKSEVTNNLGNTPTSFVFPFHNANSEYTQICGEYYDLCWTRGRDATDPYYVYKSSDGHAYAGLNRITIANNTSLDLFKDILGRETDIVGEWKMNEGTGTTTDDTSGKNNDGTLNSGASWA
ncbi:MAG: LamG-like jellyroll fold domain-containing protein [Nanoarchaeota archaeon]